MDKTIYEQLIDIYELSAKSESVEFKGKIINTLAKQLLDFIQEINNISELKGHTLFGNLDMPDTLQNKYQEGVNRGFGEAAEIADNALNSIGYEKEKLCI